MHRISQRLIVIIIAIALFSPVLVPAGPSKHPLNEDAALSLLLWTLKRDNVYAKRISLDCLTFGTEETTKEYFQFVLQENHTANCGGDRDTSPVVDRYRVNRASGNIEWLNAVDDNWQRYNRAKIKG